MDRPATSRRMSNLLCRLAGLLALIAGGACLRAVPALVHWVYATGPAAGDVAGIALFLGCAVAAFVLIMLAPPLILAGLLALMFRLRA